MDIMARDGEVSGISTKNSTCFIIKGKGKVILLQARCGPEGG